MHVLQTKQINIAALDTVLGLMLGQGGSEAVAKSVEALTQLIHVAHETGRQNAAEEIEQDHEETFKSAWGYGYEEGYNDRANELIVADTSFDPNQLQLFEPLPFVDLGSILDEAVVEPGDPSFTSPPAFPPADFYVTSDGTALPFISFEAFKTGEKLLTAEDFREGRAA